MRTAFSLVVLCGAITALAQPELKVDTIRDVQPHAPHGVYSIPRVRTLQPAIGGRIHQHLCVDLLGVDPDTAAASELFSLAWGDTEGGMPRLYIYGWTLERPFKEVIDIKIDAEGCGAYCEGFTKHYVYDLRNGNYIGYDSLFMPAGLAEVNDSLNKIWKQIVQDHVTVLNDSLVRTSSPEERERFRQTIDLYTACVDERLGAAPYVADIMPLSSGMRFFIARCGPHVIRELDELDVVEIDLPYVWLDQWFKPELGSLFR
jgi:hypothetical protein